MKVWDVATRHARYAIDGNPNWINALALAPDDSLLAVAGCDDGTLRLFDLTSGEERGARLKRALRAIVRGLAFVRPRW